MATDEKTTALLKEYDRLVDAHVYYSRFALTVFPILLVVFGVLVFFTRTESVTPLAFLYLFGVLMASMCVCHRIAIQTGVRLIESEAKLNHHLQLRGDMRLSRFTRTDLSGFDWIYLLPLVGVLLLLLTLLWIAAVNAPDKGTFEPLAFFPNLFQGKATPEDLLIAMPLILSFVFAVTMIVTECRFQRSLELETEDDGMDDSEIDSEQGLGEFMFRRRPTRRRIKRS